MAMRTYIPRPPLSNFVEMLWLLDSTAQSQKERALPTGTVELVISLREDKLWICDRQNIDQLHGFRDAMICVPHSECFVIAAAKDESVLGVHFKPGGALPFFKLPLGELHNAHVSLETLWGNAARALREPLLEVQTPSARFPILEKFLLTCITQSFVRHPAVAFMLTELQNAPHARTIAEVTNQIGIGQRHFIQVFRDEVGMSPKLFCRIQRFQEVLRRVEKGAQVEWVEIALSYGYYDQAHFINDFQAFSGLNPTAYLAQRGERNPYHVPIADIQPKRGGRNEHHRQS